MRSASLAVVRVRRVVRDVEGQSSVERRGGASLALALDASLARVEAVERRRKKRLSGARHALSSSRCFWCSLRGISGLRLRPAGAPLRRAFATGGGPDLGPNCMVRAGESARLGAPRGWESWNDKKKREPFIGRREFFDCLLDRPQRTGAAR